MRSVQVKAPPELKDEIADLAFESGIAAVTMLDLVGVSRSGTREPKLAITFETSTPKAKAFVEKLLLASFFDRETVAFDVRERRSIINTEPLHDVTYPWVIPGMDVLQDLYQFSHLTLDLVGRVFIAGCLLSYGLLNQSILLMIAGMMFIPLLPVLSAIGFGSWLGHWRLAIRAGVVLALTCALLFGGGVLIGVIGSPPVLYSDFPPVLTGMLISTAVGIASALANTDDVGRRELIGLAATSQIAIVPAWLGLCVVLELPATEPSDTVEKRLLSLLLNVVCVIVASLITYIAVGVCDSSLRVIKDEK
jgi:hypothetical protein